MGRLMDSIMAAVGLRPSDRVQISHEPIDSKTLPAAKPNIKPVETLPTAQPNKKKVEAPLDQPEEIEQTPREETKQQYVDCNSCRVIAGLLGTLAPAYIIHTVYKNYGQYPKGYKRNIFLVNGAVMASLIMTLGFGRAFEVGMFSKEKVEYTFSDHLHNDTDQIKDLFSKIKSWFEESKDSPHNSASKS